MAQTGVNDDTSSYYPPRARWYRRMFSNAWRPVRRHVDLQKLLPPRKVSPGELALGVAVPGYAFFVRDRRLIGWCFLAGYVAAALVLVAALGFPVASLAYGLLISIHATSIVFLEELWLKESKFRVRIAAAFCTLAGVWGLIYSPVLGYAERHWLLPLRMGDHVFVVHRGVAPKSIKRGEWLAYEIVGDRSPGEGNYRMYLQSGLGVDPVLALPGDRLRFTPHAVFVNDNALPLAPHMPVQGEWVMPENVWFIWPSLGISRGGPATEAGVSATMQQVAMVTQKQLIGRPFKRWFGRRQWP